MDQDEEKKGGWLAPLAMIVILAVGLGGSMAYNYRKHSAQAEAHRVAEAETARREETRRGRAEFDELVGWRLPEPPARVPLEVHPPTIPRLPLMVVNFSEVIGPEEQAKLISERLRILVQEHPVEEIRVDFNQLIETNVVSLSYQTEAGFTAQASFLPAYAMSEEMKIDSRDWYLIFGVNPEWVASLSGPEDVATAQLIIYHEYQHVKSFLQAEEKDRPIFAAMYQRGKDAPFTQEDVCRQMWRNEYQAYSLECNLAETWGVDVMGDFCEYNRTPVFGQAIFHAVVTGPKQLTQACAVTYAELAGHPRPEVYQDMVW